MIQGKDAFDLCTHHCWLGLRATAHGCRDRVAPARRADCATDRRDDRMNLACCAAREISACGAI